jgi:hypothetical protein
MDRITLRLVLLFLFFRISFLHEFITYKIHFDLHLLMVLGGLSCLLVFISGKWTDALRHRSVQCWYGFGACLFFATAFSTWRGGSLPVFLNWVRTVFPLLFLIPSVVWTRADLMKVINTIGWAGIATIALGFTAKDVVDGRMTIVAASSIGDSNDYAAHIMFVMPVILYVLFAAKKSMFRKALGLVVLPAGLYQLLSTGSRGAMVSACATMLVLLFVVRPTIKVALLVGIPTLALVAVPFVPSRAIERLTTLFQSKDAQTKEAAESAEARKRLFQQSVTLTLRHPLLGVGPGQFMENEGSLAGQAGQRGMWHQTHNTYTQVSSECGIPALILYVSAIVITLRRLWKTHSSDDPLLGSVALVMFFATLAYAMCVFFLSHAYLFAFLISTSIAIVIDRLRLTRPSDEFAAFAPGQNVYSPSLLLKPAAVAQTPALRSR